MSRDNARTPMQWDDGPHAGFTTGTPWLAVNPNHVEVNAAVQVDDANSVFAHYRRLIELRHTVPVVAHGDFTMLLPNDEQVYAFTRRLGDVELLVLANFGDDPVVARVPEPERWVGAELLVCNYPYAITEPGTAPSLRPWEACVYRRVPR
jgi:oligo-1,6-glucosidase